MLHRPSHYWTVIKINILGPDIRTLATSTGSVEAQVMMVKYFAAHNFLKLNVEKCEIVMFSHGRGVGVIP